MNSFSTWLTAVMLLLFGSMVTLAFQFPPEARVAPFVVGVPGMLLCLFQLGLDAVKAPGGRFANHRFRAAPKVGKPEELTDELPEFGPDTVSREVMMWGYFLAFVATILVFGFYVAVPVMLVSFLHFEAGLGWPRSLLAGVGGTATVYLMFGVALQARLFPGLVMPSVMSTLGL